ncbi:hypothetical protein PYW07_011106 [Mythimna separata]|uniref:SHSP domain-containing protein n=1 Tax=Mythimna separata TaxID=271217 RepID=A0AAD7Y7M6_MYTSE|nr:hypothetical protein PYW07_011106 [Mythimna separata]
MFLLPSLRVCLQPKLFSSIKNTRSLRPSIKIGKEKFQLSVDVHQFNKDEIRVKAHPEYVIIEGKQEKNTHQGYALRQFIRKFKLPEGCVTSKMKCTLNPDGILTVEAQRSFKDMVTPADVVMVPISYGPGEKKQEGLLGPPPEEEVVYHNPCANYPKVKPKDATTPTK